MRVLTERERGEGKELRKLWKSSGGGISGGRASRRRRINRKGTGIKRGGKSLTLKKYVIYFIDVNPKSRGLSGRGEWAGKKNY